eukprot:g23820.t1
MPISVEKTLERREVLNKIYALQTDVPFKDFGAGATKSSTNRTTGEDSVLPSQLDDLLPFASARNEPLVASIANQEQMDRKVRGARKLLRICTEVPVLDEMAEHSTLLGVLSRELRENAKRSYELAVAITGIFLIFANFSRFHSALSKHQCGEVFNMALRLCYNLSFDARGRAALTESSVVPRLMHAVQHAGTRKVALKLLYHMTLDPQTRSAVIRSSPHLPSLAMQLARSKEQEPEAVALLAAACLLLAEDSFMAMALRAMKHKNARMLKVLRHIASHRASRPILLDVMGGDSDSSSYAWLIQEKLSATATDRHDILVEVLGILAALDCSEVPWTELCEAGLLETLPRLLMVGFAEDDVVLEAVMLLSILALDAAAVLANSKVVALLGDLLAAKSGDPDLLVQLLFLVQVSRRSASSGCTIKSGSLHAPTPARRKDLHLSQAQRIQVGVQKWIHAKKRRAGGDEEGELVAEERRHSSGFAAGVTNPQLEMQEHARTGTNDEDVQCLSGLAKPPAATRAASAADLEASAAMLVARSSEESLNSQARSLKRQVSISSRQPQLRVVNLLGQDITLDLLYSADGRRSKEFPIFSGSSRIVTMPWCGCGAPRAGSGWMAKLQLQQIPDAEVFLHLTATSAVKSVSAKPSKPSRTQSMSSSFLGSQMRCYSADTSGSNLDLSYKLTSLPESWILVRTEVGDKLHELDVHFSSVLFVENRTALSLSVAPIGKTTWQAIRRYRSMVANDYFLRSRMLHLSDRMGESCASLCATVCGVSADLQASLQALIFSVALEPAAQICNRLPVVQKGQPDRMLLLRGVAKFASRRPAGSVDSSKRLALMQYDCNTLRMVSESLVRRGKIRVGLCDQRYNANGESLVPVTEPIRTADGVVIRGHPRSEEESDRKEAGSATAPRSAFNPVQRCFGYTVRPAPLPFHRTLLVEVVRRYTLLNHKERSSGVAQVVRFSEPLRPQFRILNRTGHGLGLRQDCDRAPGFELAPEHRMSFCWFQPEGPLKLRLRLGAQEILGPSRPKEVHIHPHCLLKNAKGHALLVRSGHKNTEMVVPHEGSVCLQRESKASEQVVLEIATCVPGSSAHWSAPIMLTKSLAGQRGFDAGAPLDLFPGESAPFVPVGALICGQGTFPVRLAVLGAEDEIRYSTVIDIELPQEVVFGAMRVKVLKERPRHIVIRDAEIKPRKNSKGLKHHLPPFVFLQRMLGSKKPKPKPRPSPTARHLSPRRKTRMISPGLSPRRRRPTLPLQMLAGTPRLTAMPSTRSLTSRISKLRRLLQSRSSLGIFWTIQGRKRCQRLRGTVLELYAQGAGVTLVDSTSLNEVAYFCADSLVVDMVKYEGAQRALEIKLGSLQLDVHDNSAGWRSNVMVRPKRSRLPARVREGRPFLDISATWLALERGAGFAAHLELAIFGLDLLRRAEPLLAALPMFGHLRRQLKTRWRSDDRCEYDDFDVPTPVFIKELLVRRIQLFVSVRFNGKASASGNCSSEALQAVDIVLRAPSVLPQ